VKVPFTYPKISNASATSWRARVNPSLGGVKGIAGRQ
jgi:hypothetical protein